MKIFKDKISLMKEIKKQSNIAFVPTMGSIHEGHLSLIKRAKKESKNVLVSIYVNPKQFELNSDFTKYPRNLSRDIRLLKKIKIKYLYLPEYNDLYSFRPKIHIHLNKFSKKLCGKFRPGHFRGVVNIVNRFLEIIKPSMIFLGKKDFQQLTLIKFHINKNKIPTKVIECPTVRQSNGVALSSRNTKLTKNQTFIANKVYKYIKNNKNLILLKNLKNKKSTIINKITLFGVKKIVYLECINLNTLRTAKKNNEKFNVFISYYLGKIRLIDNL